MYPKELTYFYFYSILIKPKAIKTLGNSIYLLLWLYDKVTYIEHGVGLVKGGHPFTYVEIAKELGKHISTITNWSKTLLDAGFIHTKKVYSKRQMFFTLGYQKKINNPIQSKRYSNRVNEVLLAQRHRTNQSDILNPLWKYLDFSSLLSSNNSDHTTSDNPAVSLKSGESNKYNTDSNTDDKYEKKINISADQQENPNSIISKVYQKYMKNIGSNRSIPDKIEAELISDALENDGVKIINEAIIGYLSKVRETDKWTPVPASRFFQKNFYTRFIGGGRLCRTYFEDDIDLTGNEDEQDDDY